LYVFDAFVKNQVGIAVWIHIWVFYSVPLVFTSVFVPVPCSFLLLWCSMICGWVLWYFQYCSFYLVLPWLFVVLCADKWFFFNSCDECHWNFDGDWIEHVDCFW
jgi:hypothetical protein